MEYLSSICDIVILISAFLLAIERIYSFFSDAGKGVKKKVDKVKKDE
jgi:hypothetical protein